VINPLSLPRTDQIFTFIDPITGIMTTYASSKLLRYVPHSGLEPCIIPVLKEQAAIYCKERNIELHRLNRLGDLSKWTPILILLDPGEEKKIETRSDEAVDGILIDGHHRYVFAASRGIKEILAWMVPVSIHKRFILDLTQEQQRAIMGRPGSGVP
jgi:hypothetical protein